MNAMPTLLTMPSSSSPSAADKRYSLGILIAETAMRRVHALVVAAMIWPSVGRAAPPLSDLAGTYQLRSAGCTSSGVPNERDEWEECDPLMVDCLSLEPISATAAKVTVVSYQTNMHQCSASGIARLVAPDHLAISGRDLNKGDVLDKDASVDIRYSDHALTISGPRELCGARANWGFQFQASTRITNYPVQCFEPFVRAPNGGPNNLRKKKAKVVQSTDPVPLHIYAQDACLVKDVGKRLSTTSLMANAPSLAKVGFEKLRWISLAEYRSADGVFYGQTALVDIHDSVAWVLESDVIGRDTWYGPFRIGLSALKGCSPTAIPFAVEQ
jgi:hypothetical protein